MSSKYIMITGTSSHAGKSVIAAGLCRIFSDMGYAVVPFKAQNMSLNSWVTKDGDEIGIAQAVQAWAARREPSSDMNPVLLKPKGHTVSQVVVLGRPIGDKTVEEYYGAVEDMLGVVEGALRRLSRQNDIIVMEGAGSPAEINLYDREIANIRAAKLVEAPVIVVGDIERGGVFASLYGTVELLPEEDRRLVCGFIINKFRGDMTLLKPGIAMLEERTGIPVLGVIPYFAVRLPSEDSVSLGDKLPDEQKRIEVAIIRLPRISNFTDFEPLESLAKVRYVALNENLGTPDAIIIPGTKNTIDDLKALKSTGMDQCIRTFAGHIPIIGICGGYQMLGRCITDQGFEDIGNNRAAVAGLGLLPVDTVFSSSEKETKQVTKVIVGKGPILKRIKGQTVVGYEIHMGKTPSSCHIFSDDGAEDETGLVLGTYLHGLFHNENVRDAFIGYLLSTKGAERDRAFGTDGSDATSEGTIEGSSTPTTDPFDDVADVIRQHIDIDALLDLMESP